MFDLKPLSPQAITAALERVERYRLLNEPADAESICRDILQVDPDNQQAIAQFILSLTDRFIVGLADRYQEAQAAAARLREAYERAYYAGIICERRAKAHYEKGSPQAGHVAYEWLRRAMENYEQAEELRPEDNDDSLLRWNCCARIIMENPDVEADETTPAPLQLE